MVFIALPVSYITSFKMGCGLAGLWIGYSLSAFCLTVMYSTVLITLDWPKTALEASISNEFSQTLNEEENE